MMFAQSSATWVKLQVLVHKVTLMMISASSLMVLSTLMFSTLSTFCFIEDVLLWALAQVFLLSRSRALFHFIVLKNKLLKLFKFYIGPIDSGFQVPMGAVMCILKQASPWCHAPFFVGYVKYNTEYPQTHYQGIVFVRGVKRVYVVNTVDTIRVPPAWKLRSIIFTLRVSFSFSQHSRNLREANR